MPPNSPPDLEEADMSEAHLFSSMTFPEIYERILVQPLFRPFAEQLIRRLEPAAALHHGSGPVDAAAALRGVCGAA